MTMQTSISFLIGLSALIGSVIAPTLYIGGIKETNAVQANQISTLEKNYGRLEQKLDSQDEKLNALLVRNGIDPTKLNAK